MPFNSLVVASRNDRYAAFGSAKRMARKWGSRLIDAGPLGHINADSDIADWPYGKYLLDQMIQDVLPLRPTLRPDGAYATLMSPGTSDQGTVAR